MKTRRVFSAPDIDTAEAALHVALHMGIQPDHAALVGRPEIEMTQMPDDEKEGSPTDFMPAAMRGLIGGGVVGLVVGLIQYGTRNRIVTEVRQDQPPRY